MSDLSWNEIKCPVCGDIVEGEDLGDREDYLTFECDCGQTIHKQVELPTPCEEDIYGI